MFTTKISTINNKELIMQELDTAILVIVKAFCLCLCVYAPYAFNKIKSLKEQISRLETRLEQREYDLKKKDSSYATTYC